MSMTVKQLKQYLATIPDDAIVQHMLSDEEGVFADTISFDLALLDLTGLGGGKFFVIGRSAK